MKKKILVITPKFPYPPTGACEQDRARGIEMLIERGYDVSVITKVFGPTEEARAREIGERLGISIQPIRYKYLGLSTRGRLRNAVLRLVQPWYADGAAFEYREPEIQRVLTEKLDSFQPDLVWFDYTYLWPLYGMVRKRGLPIITRSINFEAVHFLEEDGRTAINYIKSIPKFLSEWITGRWSDALFSISPAEEALYKKWGARHVVNLPLRGIFHTLDFTAPIHEAAPLHVFFCGSTYQVSHNRAALEFLLSKIIPEVERRYPRQFHFHVFGGKVPDAFAKYFSASVIKEGYLPVEEFDRRLSAMDIAVVPSLYGAGMQQKIFEPLARGFPTVASRRGLAGYAFTEGKHIFLADRAEEFASALGTLRSAEQRAALAAAAKARAQELFSQSVVSKIMFDEVERLLDS